MTKQFNLLPARYVERMAERRSAGVVGAALLALVAVLMVASVAQSRQMAQAERERTVEQARNAELQARRSALAPFRELSNGIVGRELLLGAAMETQVSWAAVLTSLSETFPAEASLTSLTAESALPAFGVIPPVQPADQSRVIGSTTFAGYSVEEFTPGVERVLDLLELVTGLSQPLLQEGVDEEIGERPVTNFQGTTFVDGTALSGRYAQGLPPEDDVELPRAGGGASAPAAPSPSPSQAPG